MTDLLAGLQRLDAVRRAGRVVEVRANVVRALLPDTCIGERCLVQGHGEPLEAEVISFDERHAWLMTLGNMTGIHPGARVEPFAGSPVIPCGPEVDGRVLDALGRPLDDGPPLHVTATAPVHQTSPKPLSRRPIDRVVETGVRPLDGLLTVGRGQRLGILAGAGVGKSTLLSMLARNVQADAIVVALIGERGREVREFLDEGLGPDGLRRATVIVSLSDQPALMRARAAYAATAIAEARRAAGQNVILLMDSVTRYARALREIALAAGEPPGRQGFPASVFAALPQLFERAGTDAAGSITAFYTVLVAGDDLTEPVADETISLLDGHIVLSRKIAAAGRFPAIDVLASNSRLMLKLTDARHQALARRARAVLGNYAEHEDKITTGLYDPPTEDERKLVALHPRLCSLLEQPLHERAAFADTLHRLERTLA